jgi:hypothetical protein
MADKYRHLRGEREKLPRPRRTRRNSQCVNSLGMLKVAYNEAEAKAKAIERSMRAYECQIFQRWHLTKKPAR